MSGRQPPNWPEPVSTGKEIHRSWPGTSPKELIPNAVRHDREGQPSRRRDCHRLWPGGRGYKRNTDGHSGRDRSALRRRGPLVRAPLDSARRSGVAWASSFSASVRRFPGRPIPGGPALKAPEALDGIWRMWPAPRRAGMHRRAPTESTRRPRVLLRRRSVRRGEAGIAAGSVIAEREVHLFPRAAIDIGRPAPEGTRCPLLRR